MPKKILLADDSITIQKVISITFSGADYQLEIASDGEEAVSKARSMKPDLVMVDVAMPGKNGYEVCEAIKKDPAISSTPVMLLAGTFEPLDKGQAERVKADDHIVKPFESQELIDKVNSLLSSGETATAPAPAEAAGESFDIAEDMWEEGDFLGFTEDFGAPPETPQPREPVAAQPAEETGGEPAFDLGYTSEDIFASEEEESGKAAGEGGFVDLEFTTDELSADQLGANEGPGFAEEPAGVETPSEAPPEEPSFEPPSEEPVFEEPTIGEAASEAPSEEPSFEPPSEEPVFEEPTFEEAAAEAPEAEHFGTGADTVVWGGEEDRIEEPSEAEAGAGPETEIEDFGGDVLEVPEESAQGEPPASPEPQAPAAEPSERPLRVVGSEAAEKVAREAAEVVTERLGDKFDIPPGMVEEIVAKLAREVVEEIAWEVVPEMAEELITKELEKVRAAFGKLK